MRRHVAVVLPRYVDAILAGRKTVEVRLSMNRCLPWGRVAAGDVVFFKERGGPVRAAARVARVEAFEELTERRVRGLERRYARAADAVGAAYWGAKRGAAYATMVWIEGVHVPTRPPRVGRLYGAGWVELPRAEMLTASSRPSMRRS